MQSNASGRCRTADNLFPMDSAEKKATPQRERGSWKVWTPEAVLRAAFGQPAAALRQVACEIDGASAPHIHDCQLFVSSVILDEQEKAFEKIKQKAKHDSQSGSPHSFWILDLMFDDTELELKLEGEGPGASSILASHAQPSDQPLVHQRQDFLELRWILQLLMTFRIAHIGNYGTVIIEVVQNFSTEKQKS